MESAFALERRGHFLGRPIRFCGWQGERVTRLFRRARAHFDDARVHERVRIEGRIGRLAGRIEHDSYATEAECARKLRDYARAGALEACAAGRTAGGGTGSCGRPCASCGCTCSSSGSSTAAAGLRLCALAAAQVRLKYATLRALSRHDHRHPGTGESAP